MNVNAICRNFIIIMVSSLLVLLPGCKRKELSETEKEIQGLGKSDS